MLSLWTYVALCCFCFRLQRSYPRLSTQCSHSVAMPAQTPSEHVPRGKPVIMTGLERSFASHDFSLSMYGAAARGAQRNPKQGQIHVGDLPLFVLLTYLLVGSITYWWHSV